MYSQGDVMIITQSPRSLSQSRKPCCFEYLCSFRVQLLFPGGDQTIPGTHNIRNQHTVGHPSSPSLQLPRNSRLPRDHYSNANSTLDTIQLHCHHLPLRCHSQQLPQIFPLLHGRNMGHRRSRLTGAQPLQHYVTRLALLLGPVG